MSQTTAVPQSPGSLPGIIRNDVKLYQGDLIHYFRILFHHAQNLRHPYHNFRHMCHVLYLCFKACLFYRDSLSPRRMRNLLIAALFHDFDHTGMLGNDDLNIIRAVRALRRHALPEDVSELGNIEKMIQGTEYPYVVPLGELDLCGRILRDADMSQALSVAWIQQVIFGLATEWNKKPLDVLKQQEPFMRGLSFLTEWAQQEFPACELAAKIDEAHELTELLEMPAQAT